jgi:tetratricopeptide (TPR) repeat protein
MMTRAIPLALALGALVAGAGLCATTAPAWLAAVAPWSAAPERQAEAALAPGDWPICSAMGQIGADADWAQLDADFAAGKKALAAENWSAAIAALELAALRDPLNADIQNYIGYAYRRLRQLGPAMQHYQQALMLNRRHRSAHEHLGELYLVLGEPAQAEQQLATLQQICLIPCREYDDLKHLIATYGKRATR